MPDPLTVVILGAGRVGSALARLLPRAGVEVVGWWNRGADRARQASAENLRCTHGSLPAELGRATAVLIAIADRAVPAMAATLAGSDRLHREAVVFHCGGARPAGEALAALADNPRGTFHPLVAVSAPDQAERCLPGALLALEGDPPALHLGKRLARALGARPVILRAEQMRLYHAAAVLASNHTVAAWHAAATLLRQIGIDAPDTALLPLVRSTVENLARLGLPRALTGPVRRGDASTVEAHLEALSRAAPALVALYRQGTLAAVRAVRDCDDGGGDATRPQAEDAPPGAEALRQIVAAVGQGDES